MDHHHDSAREQTTIKAPLGYHAVVNGLRHSLALPCSPECNQLTWQEYETLDSRFLPSHACHAARSIHIYRKEERNAHAAWLQTRTEDGHVPS